MPERSRDWAFVGVFVVVALVGAGYLYAEHVKNNAPPAASATPAPPPVDWTVGKCRDGAIKIHDEFATCPRSDHAVRVRNSSIIVCVCTSSDKPDPEEK